jgi:hypothetical protein
MLYERVQSIAARKSGMFYERVSPRSNKKVLVVFKKTVQSVAARAS